MENKTRLKLLLKETKNFPRETSQEVREDYDKQIRETTLEICQENLRVSSLGVF